MTVRASLVGGALAGALGAAIGGGTAVVVDAMEAVWLGAALGAAFTSLAGWMMAKKRLRA